MDKLKPNQFLLPSGALITERPILFSTEMIQANLDGRKTQTRRTKGLELRNENPNDWTRQGARTLNMFPDFNSFDKKINSYPGFEFLKVKGQEEGKTQITRPRFTPGDLLWFRETWARLALDEIEDARAYIYKADYAYPEKAIKASSADRWKPSIHMLKAASRIWAMVEEIIVERLLDISEEDAKAEGVIEYEDGTFKNYFTKKGLRSEDGVECLLAKGSFQSLWISINGQASWDSNPWVWVIKYRILSTTGRPSMDVIDQNYLEVTGEEVSNG